MAAHQQRRVSLVLFLLFLLTPAVAQPGADASGQRQKAMALFNQGKRLEALPLLEDLAHKDPKDSEMLVALAASLVDHASTLSDADAAGKERLRARDLVQRAWELGNYSNLEENLRQLLNELPASGALKFSENSAVEEAMNAGEAAFARRDFDEALKDYAKALELEPRNYPAVLFTANTYDRKNDFAKAADWYERAMRLDPNTETAYRYYADMLAKQGDMAKARAMLIRAAVAEPYNKIVWREIRAWTAINNAVFNPVFVAIPVPRGDNTAVGGAKLQPELVVAWKTYYSVKSEWKKGDRFKQRYPGEEYRHSLAEEHDALTATAMILEKLKEDKKTAELVTNDPSAQLLLKLHEADLIDAYVLFSLGDEELGKDYAGYRLKNREKLEAYMDKFAVPPTQR